MGVEISGLDDFEKMLADAEKRQRGAVNTVDIDEAAQKDYAILHGDDVTKMTVQQIREYNTGTQVLLTGRITPVNAMEDLRVTFTM